MAHNVCPQMRREDLDSYWFQQDGVTLTGHPDLHIWPFRIFFLWDYLRSKMYASNPHTIEVLKPNIRAKMTIPTEMLEKVMENVAKRSHFA